MNIVPKFSVGEAVTYTNQQGVVFRGKTVKGIDCAKWSSPEPRYFITPTDTPWFSFPESGLARAEPGEVEPVVGPSRSATNE